MTPTCNICKYFKHLKTSSANLDLGWNVPVIQTFFRATVLRGTLRFFFNFLLCCINWTGHSFMLPMNSTVLTTYTWYTVTSSIHFIDHSNLNAEPRDTWRFVLLGVNLNCDGNRFWWFLITLSHTFVGGCSRYTTVTDYHFHYRVLDVFKMVFKLYIYQIMKNFTVEKKTNVVFMKLIDGVWRPLLVAEHQRAHDHAWKRNSRNVWYI